MTYYCDGCQTPAPRAGLCARCSPPLTCPGLARLVVGTFVFFGAAGGLDQTPLVEAQTSVQLLVIGAGLAGWGTLRTQRGSTAGMLRGIRNRLIARRYLRRVGALRGNLQ